MDPAHATDQDRFDRLCLLRALYTHRGDRDRVSCISIDEAIRLAEQELTSETHPTITPH
jgi:hypothetical protein